MQKQVIVTYLLQIKIFLSLGCATGREKRPFKICKEIRSFFFEIVKKADLNFTRLRADNFFGKRNQT